MSFDSLLIHALVVRYAASDGTPTTLAEVRGLIQPKAVQEMALASQAGVEVGDHTAFLRPLDGLRNDCWFEHAGGRYDIVGIRDAAGRGHHLEIDCRRVG